MSDERKPKCMFYVIGQRHDAQSAEDFITLYYDYSRGECLKKAKEYIRQHGYAYETPKGAYSLADILLVERDGSDVVSATPMIYFSDYSPLRL